jgi:hypothetical protein
MTEPLAVAILAAARLPESLRQTDHIGPANTGHVPGVDTATRLSWIRLHPRRAGYLRQRRLCLSVSVAMTTRTFRRMYGGGGVALAEAETRVTV